MITTAPVVEHSFPVHLCPTDPSDEAPSDRVLDLSLARQHLESIKKEVGRGTPVDADVIERMEAALERLERGSVSDES